MLRTFSALLVLTSLALADVQFVRAQSPFTPWLGTYKNTASSANTTDVIERATEQGTREMGFVRRKVARSRLKAINPPYEQVRIVERGDHLLTEFDGRRYTAPLNGRAEQGTDPEGKSVTVSFQAEGNTLHARYVAEDGEKRMDFVRSPDGRELTMNVTVLSPKLPEPVRYSVRYVRE